MKHQQPSVRLSPSLMNDLLGLSRAEKLMAAQLLLREIAMEENVILEDETNAVVIEDKKTRFFTNANHYCLTLPENYHFDREEANAR
jgi:hypothetical protein